MKALFNGTCDNCHVFKPRTAYVYRKASVRWEIVRTKLCEDCRKVLAGQYRVHAIHKSEPSVPAQALSFRK